MIGINTEIHIEYYQYKGTVPVNAAVYILGIGFFCCVVLYIFWNICQITWLERK